MEVSFILKNPKIASRKFANLLGNTTLLAKLYISDFLENSIVG